MPTDATAESFGSNFAISAALNLAILTVIFFLKYQYVYIWQHSINTYIIEFN